MEVVSFMKENVSLWQAHLESSRGTQACQSKTRFVHCTILFTFVLQVDMIAKMKRPLLEEN